MPRFLRSLFGLILLLVVVLAVGLSLLARKTSLEIPKSESKSASGTKEKSSSSSTVVSSKSPPTWKQFQENRSIALIHVGKGGGLSLRAMTSLKCRLPRNQVTIQSIQTCIVDSFGSSSTTNPKSNPLALQTIFYAHMRSIPADEMNAATSWLIALRNPIDRLISAYQYSHPANCQDATLLPNSTKGCINHFILNKQQPTQTKNEQQLAQLFVHCFPNADMKLLHWRLYEPMTIVLVWQGPTYKATVLSSLPPIYDTTMNTMHPRYWMSTMQMTKRNSLESEQNICPKIFRI